MDRMGGNKIILGIVVSSDIRYCRNFMNKYGLNTEYFVIATKIRDIRGIPIDVPVMVTYNQQKNDDILELLEAIHHRFTNVRYIIDY